MSIYHTGLMDVEWFRHRAFLTAVCLMDKTGMKLRFNNFPEFTWYAEWAYVSYMSVIWQTKERQFKGGRIHVGSWSQLLQLTLGWFHYLGTWPRQIIMKRCGGVTGHLLAARQHRIGSEDRIPPTREHLHLPTSSNLPMSLLPLDYTSPLSFCQRTHPPVI